MAPNHHGKYRQNPWKHVVGDSLPHEDHSDRSPNLDTKHVEE